MLFKFGYDVSYGRTNVMDDVILVWLRVETPQGLRVETLATVGGAGRRACSFTK